MEPIKTLGKILPQDKANERDAVHIAVLSVTAGETLKPGDHVGLMLDGQKALKSFDYKKIGIVDPFLKKEVQAGQKFWLFLYPNSITSLRHLWSHPIVDEVYLTSEEDKVRKARETIENIAARLCIDPDEMIRGARAWLATYDGQWGGAYLVQQGSDHWRDDFPSYAVEFWTAYEELTGEEVKDKTESFFSCSC